MIAASEKMWHREETFEYISLFTALASLLKAGTKAKKEKDKKSGRSLSLGAGQL